MPVLLLVAGAGIAVLLAWYGLGRPPGLPAQPSLQAPEAGPDPVTYGMNTSASAVSTALAVPEPEEAPASSPQVDPPPLARIQRDGSELYITLADVPLHQAIALLADKSGTVIHGAVAQLPAARVHLHWQGRDWAAAWQRLLDQRANFSVSCDGAACQLWIVGPVTAVGAGVPWPALAPAVRTQALDEVEPEPEN